MTVQSKTAQTKSDQKAARPPVAAKKNRKTSTHGIKRNDPYHWLRDENWQKVMVDPDLLNGEIREYLEAENQYFKDAFDNNTTELQKEIYDEIRARMKEDETGVPTPHGPFAYYSKMETGKQYPLMVRTMRDGGDETILLDCNKEAAEGYFGFGGAFHDPNHKFLAWSADRAGSEYYTIKIRNIESGQDIDDELEKTSGAIVWANDSKNIFYTALDQNHRPYRVMEHRVGNKQSDDKIIYEESDAGFFVGLAKTLSSRFIMISSHDHQTGEIHLIDTMNNGEMSIVSPRQTGHEYSVDERNGELFILTNCDNAKDFKIVRVDAKNPEQANWKDEIAHNPGTLIVNCFVIKNHLIRLERFEGLPRIIIRDLLNGEEKTIGFEEEAYALGVWPGYEFDTTSIRFNYSSPTTPSQTYDYDIATGERVLRKQQEIPSGHNSDDYVTSRIFAPSGDQKVPITLLHHKDTALDGSAPCLLYGYGSYGLSIPAGFSISNLSLIDRGFVYAIAHVRGGMEKGYQWYENGRRDLKTNTFDDFIAVTQHLGEQKIVAKDKIIAHGGSAGGMLMGAIANLQPDMFAGIIAQVPFVDVLNTMLDDTLPLTPPEWPEWGNPITSKADFEMIKSYSPYDNVEQKAYPSMLVLAGLTDPRVTYWEPAKWVALLREKKTDNNPLFLKTNMEAGHGGASGRFERIKESALVQAFALRTAGKSFS